jgi:hypothetical protein
MTVNDGTVIGILSNPGESKKDHNTKNVDDILFRSKLSRLKTSLDLERKYMTAKRPFKGQFHSRRNSGY